MTAPALHEHERGASLTADCDNWCRSKHDEFTRSLKKTLVDAFMEKLSPSWRYRWCEPKPDSWCGCRGCVNGSGRIKQSGFTKEDWQDWVDRNPQSNDDSDTVWSTFRITIGDTTKIKE